MWSCGVTLFAMVCGFLPFEHTSTNVLYKKIIAGAYVSPPHLSRECKVRGRVGVGVGVGVGLTAPRVNLSTA